MPETTTRYQRGDRVVISNDQGLDDRWVGLTAIVLEDSSEYGNFTRIRLDPGCRRPDGISVNEFTWSTSGLSLRESLYEVPGYSVDGCDCPTCTTGRLRAQQEALSEPEPEVRVFESDDVDPDIHDAFSQYCPVHRRSHQWDQFECAWRVGWPDYGDHCRAVAAPTECECWDCVHGDCDFDPCDMCVTEREAREREEARERAYGLINNYSYRPTFRFYGDGPTFLGVELELYSGQLYEAAEAACDIMGNHGYLKEDSSVDGFEIVTHPHDYDSHVADMPWAALLEAMREYDMYEDHGAGLHVHVSRSAFSNPAHAFRWQKFMYANQRLVTDIARRDDDQWAAWPRRSNRRRRTMTAIAKSMKMDPAAEIRDEWGDLVSYANDPYAYLRAARGNCDRYQAINPQNRETLEVRVFGSTTDPDDMYATVGLLDASVEYTRNLTVRQIVKENALTRAAFKEFVTGNDAKKAYPALASKL